MTFVSGAKAGMSDWPAACKQDKSAKYHFFAIASIGSIPRVVPEMFARVIG